MKTSITGHSIANEVRMKRTQHKGAFLLVEGENDVRAMRAFVDSASCHVVIAHGKGNAVTAISILRGSENGVLGLLDADFERVMGTVPTDPNIVLTDTHDMDAQLFFSPALDKVLAEFSDAKLASDFVTNAGSDIRTRVIQSASLIGHIRLYSAQRRAGLNFDGLDLPAFLDKKTLEVDESVLANDLVTRSPGCTARIPDLRNALLTSLSKGHPVEQMCCGHDLVSVLQFGLVNSFGAYNARSLTPQALAGNLRIAYSDQIFRNTGLYHEIREWEKRNHPFRILRQ